MTLKFWSCLQLIQHNYIILYIFTFMKKSEVVAGLLTHKNETKWHLYTEGNAVNITSVRGIVKIGIQHDLQPSAVLVVDTMPRVPIIAHSTTLLLYE